MTCARFFPICLFPAHAGVIPEEMALMVLRMAFPRACGGDPVASRLRLILDFFSPRMRG